MPKFLEDSCYDLAHPNATCIEFHQDKHHRHGFPINHLVDYSIEPNPNASDDKNQPPQKLSLAFSSADVVVLGWRLDSLADNLRENQLSALCVIPKRYGEIERSLPFVASIKITPLKQ